MLCDWVGACVLLFARCGVGVRRLSCDVLVCVMVCCVVVGCGVWLLWCVGLCCVVSCRAVSRRVC